MRCRYLIAAVVIAGALTGSGCVLSRKKAAAQTPPAPKPAATQSASNEPLSIPQTDVKLPPPQPVNPDALATVPEAQPLPAPPETNLPQRPRRPPAVVLTKPPETPPAPPPSAPAEERPTRIQPLVTPEQQGRILDTLNERKRRIDERLHQMERRHPTEQEQNIIARIRSFQDLSEQARKRGDLAQADALSERALILAQELPVDK
jgi:hypothetical protein